MENILLLTNQYLKDNSPIMGNVDDSQITIYIKKAQKLHIERIVGTDLYNRILTDVQNNTLAGSYKTLVDDYLIPVLVEYTVYEYLPFSWAKFTNKSVSKSSSENATPLEKEDLVYIREGVKNSAEYYSQRAINYLIANSTLFPEYSTNSTVDDIQPQRNKYFGGLYIPGMNN